jgi:hypothetical protein
VDIEVLSFFQERDRDLYPRLLGPTGKALTAREYVSIITKERVEDGLGDVIGVAVATSPVLGGCHVEHVEHDSNRPAAPFPKPEGPTIAHKILWEERFRGVRGKE